MVTEKISDIFEEFENGGINVLVHQANCFHTMGGGIARIIADKFPDAKRADELTKRGDKEKLGSFSVATLQDGRRIVNVYSQYDTSAMFNTKNEAKTLVETEMEKDGRATRYDAVFVGLNRLKRIMMKAVDPSRYIIGIPYGYGSDLAGGSWPIVRAIIETIFGETPINVVICRLPGKPDLK